MLELTITNEQKIKVTATPVTAAGNPAALDGPITVTVISGDATVQSVDSLSFYLISGNAGDSTFLVDGDADLGAGIVNVQDTITLHVEGALAANLGLVAAAAEPK